MAGDFGARGGEWGGQGWRGSESGCGGRGSAPRSARPLDATHPPPPLPSSPPPPPGFDPLNFGANKDALEWYRNAELVHCRWSMLAVAGILIPEVRQ